MGYKSVRVGLCLLALCGMAPIMGIRSHGRIATAQTPTFDESRRGEAIDGAFGSDARGSLLKQGSHLSGADAATSGRTTAFSGDSQMALAGRADTMGYKVESGRDVSSSNEAAVSRTMNILCAEYSLCIEYDPATRFGDWQGDAAPLDGSYLSAEQFGGSSGGVLRGNAGSGLPATNDAGGVIPTMLSTADSSALTSVSGLATPGAVTQSALAAGNSGILTVAATGAVTRALTSSLARDDNSYQTDPPHLGGGSDAPRVTPPVIQHAAAPGSSSTPTVDSELQAAGDQVINQSTSSVNWWPTADVPGPDSWAPEFHDPGSVNQFSTTSVSDPPTTPTDPVVDPASPVPEPSQFVLMFTVIALTALAAKRSAFKRRAAAGV